MSTKLVNPTHLYDGSPIGMSQAKVDLASGFVFVSGQVDWGGDSLEDVLQLRVYVRGELADSMSQVVPALARHFGAVRPAMTGIGVTSLASRDTLIEIEALAKLRGHA